MTDTTSGPNVVIITGLSGAGRSQAANVLEDIAQLLDREFPG